MIYEKEDWVTKHERKETEKALLGWHKWFAWYPVKVGISLKTGKEMYAWLTVIERRFIFEPAHFYDGISGRKFAHEYKTKEYRLAL